MANTVTGWTGVSSLRMFGQCYVLAVAEAVRYRTDFHLISGHHNPRCAERLFLMLSSAVSRERPSVHAR
ncbi:hypothetical protein LMG29542_06926 [Paraburkholderia humisilvae]|uniref:Uncharacterized protein n=1 Tax=Paraburkholderia humisilvae TaxID=627669 RepID=A0A6J5F4S3_9BURK|nr:hypothetical protein LMG29542_06926 [Paraburkholderia humisilvae]